MLYADGRYGNQVEPTDHNSQIPTTGTKAFKNVIAVVNLLVEIGPIGLPGIFQRGVYITCNWWVQLWALVAKYPKMPPHKKKFPATLLYSFASTKVVCIVSSVEYYS